MASRLQPKDMLFAFKAISLFPGLTATEMRVAAVIIDHFHQQSGRCDPSISRLAELLGISERAVFRAINKLAAVFPMKRITHGGKFGRNRYIPDWKELHQIEKRWAELKRSLNERLKESPDYCQGSQVDPDRDVNQTCPSNLSGTCHGEPANDRAGGDAAKGLGNEPKTDKPLTFRMRNALNAAERRWDMAFQIRFRKHPEYEKLVEAITPEISAMATNAEFRKKGAGIVEICRRLNLPGGRAG